MASRTTTLECRGLCGNTFVTNACKFGCNSSWQARAHGWLSEKGGQAWCPKCLVGTDWEKDVKKKALRAVEEKFICRDCVELVPAAAEFSIVDEADVTWPDAETEKTEVQCPCGAEGTWSKVCTNGCDETHRARGHGWFKQGSRVWCPKCCEYYGWRVTVENSRRNFLCAACVASTAQ